MKKLLLPALLLITAFALQAQDYSTINFISKGTSYAYDIYLNNQKVATLPKNTNLQYKVYSEGRIVIKTVYDDFTSKDVIEVKHNNTYYFHITFSYKKQLDEKRGKKYFEENKSTIQAEENRNNPLIKPSTALVHDENDFPHSIINFVRSDYYRNIPSFISLPNQQQFGLPTNAVVQYKIYSEGEISIALDYVGLGMTGTQYCNLNVKRGNEYYVFAGKSEFSSVERATVQEILDDPKVFTKREENIDLPINKSSIRDLEKKEGKGQGTCFLISASGYLVTNAHCVENSKEINILGIDRDFTTKYQAKVVGIDPSNDLALLKLSNTKLKFEAPPFAVRSSGVAQAEKVYAIGYPVAQAMGEEVKITEGIISAKSGLQNDISKFQISASVNHGNSGGPLIDEQGNVIGIIYAKSKVAESAGYAIKASYLETFLKNVEGFEYPTLTNTIKEIPLTEKIARLRDYIFILETN